MAQLFQDCLNFENAYSALEVPWGELDAFCEQHQWTRQQKRQHSDYREEVYVIHSILHHKEIFFYCDSSPVDSGNLMKGKFHLVIGKEFLAEDIP